MSELIRRNVPLVLRLCAPLCSPEDKAKMLEEAEACEREPTRDNAEAARLAAHNAAHRVSFSDIAHACHAACHCIARAFDADLYASEVLARDLYTQSSDSYVDTVREYVKAHKTRARACECYAIAAQMASKASTAYAASVGDQQSRKTAQRAAERALEAQKQASTYGESFYADV